MADDHVGTKSYIHTDIIQTHILNKLDGPTLLSAGCASYQLHALSTQQKLWTDICNSTWPSVKDPRVQKVISTFPSGYRSFFSDSFSSPYHQYPPSVLPPSPTSLLISAVDLHYKGNVVFSKVKFTDTKTDRFLLSPFEVDCFETVYVVNTGYDDVENNMTLSWILIDPTRHRSMNLSNIKPVSVKQISKNDIKVEYGIATGLVHCSIKVTCGVKEKGELHVTDVSLQVKDVDGRSLSGKDSLVILQRVMESGRRKRGMERRGYESYLEMRRERRERRKWEERRVDVTWLAIEMFVLIVLWAMIMKNSCDNNSCKYYTNCLKFE